MVKLALKNLKTHKLTTLFSGLSIAIATASLLTFFTVNNAIHDASFSELEKRSPLNQITIRPALQDGSIFSLSSAEKLTTDSITEISQLPNIASVEPEIQFQNFSSISASLLGSRLSTDTLVFGVSEAFIQSELQPSTDWDRAEAPYPAIIPAQILELYNFAIAGPRSLPSLTPDDILGRELTLTLNKSTLFPALGNKTEQIPLRIVAISDKTNLIGVTIPIKLVRDLNTKYFPNTPESYSQLFANVTDPSKISQTAEQIEALGYSANYFQKQAQDVEAKLLYLSSTITIISVIIILISAIAIISTFLTKTTEKKSQLGLYRALGASKSQIYQLITMEALIIGLTSSIIGAATTTLLLPLAPNLNQLANLNIQITLAPSTELIFTTIALGTFLTLIASLFPATLASRIAPIEALKST